MSADIKLYENNNLFTCSYKIDDSVLHVCLKQNMKKYEEHRNNEGKFMSDMKCILDHTINLLTIDIRCSI